MILKISRNVDIEFSSCEDKKSCRQKRLNKNTCPVGDEIPKQ